MSITGNDLYLLKAYRKLGTKQRKEITPVLLETHARSFPEYNHDYLPDPLERVQTLLETYSVLNSN